MHRLLVCAALLIHLLPIAAQAADIAVLPVRVELSAGQDRQAITVTNQGKEGVTMQVEAAAWSQTDGVDHYTPSDDLLVNPPLFTVPPGRSQILRLGLRRPAAGEKELAYRLFLREVPAASQASARRADGKVSVLLELRLPVYVAPAKVVHSHQWRASRDAKGQIVLSVLNAGNVHLVVGELKLRAAGARQDAAPLAATKTSVSVLPGQSRRWVLRPEKPLTSPRVELEVATDRGPHHVALDLLPE